MARWQPSKSDISPRKGYIPEIENDQNSNDYLERPSCYWCDNDATHGTNGPGDGIYPSCGSCCEGCGERGCDSPELGTETDNIAAAKVVAKTETPRGQRSPLNLPMNWED